MRIVVTGANRGLGLALTRRLVEHGHRVEATTRDPEGATDLGALASRSGGLLGVHRLEVTDAAQCHALATALGDGPVDMLVNNAGIDSGFIPFEAVDYDQAARIYAVDALAPLRLTHLLLPSLERAGGVVLNVSSRLASIARSDGLSVPYRMAKAALNMQTRSVAAELRERGVAVVAVSPGWVRTDMGGADAPLSVEHATDQLVALALGLSMTHTGRFLDLEGGDIPW